MFFRFFWKGTLAFIQVYAKIKIVIRDDDFPRLILTSDKFSLGGFRGDFCTKRDLYHGDRWMRKRTPFWGNGSGFGAEASHQFRLTFFTLVLADQSSGWSVFFLANRFHPNPLPRFLSELSKKPKKLPGKP